MRVIGRSRPYWRGWASALACHAAKCTETAVAVATQTEHGRLRYLYNGELPCSVCGMQHEHALCLVGGSAEMRESRASMARPRN